MLQSVLGTSDVLRVQHQLVSLAVKYSRPGTWHTAAGTPLLEKQRMETLVNQVVFNALSFVRTRMDENFTEMYDRENINLILHPNIGQTVEDKPTLHILLVHMGALRRQGNGEMLNIGTRFQFKDRV